MSENKTLLKVVVEEKVKCISAERGVYNEVGTKWKVKNVSYFENISTQSLLKHTV